MSWRNALLVGLVTLGLGGCLTGKQRSTNDASVDGDGSGCEEVCVPGVGQCVEDNVRFCSKDPSGCPRWTAPVACPPEQPFCSNARCEAVCDDECDARGKERCETGGHQICGQYDSDKCLEWGPVLACGADELCWEPTGECLRDCNGQPCSCDPGETEPCANVGTCVNGVRECIVGKFGPCEWEVGPKAETCDGKDNDCNSIDDDPGMAAEACTKQAGVCKEAVKKCGGSQGWLDCGDAQYSAAAQSNGKTYESTESLCDGEDNDCNDEIDEPAKCCQPQCDGKACGADDECGNPCKEGTCPTGEHCVEGPTEVACECAPDCDGKACGADDGCEGLCSGGSCGENASCQGNTCVCDYVPCGATPITCCAEQEVCKDDPVQCCTPDCTNRQCGKDPVCGVEACGGCAVEAFCFDVTGVCGQWSVAHSSSKPLKAVWGYANGAVAVGDGGLVAVYDGSWKESTPVTENLRGVWANASDDVWIVGENGLIAHFGGSDWTTEAALTTEHLNAVWSDGTNVWAVGENKTVLKRTGDVWGPETIIFGVTNLNAVWGSSGTNIIVVGDNSAILHNKGSWTQGTSPIAAIQLNAVAGASETKAWAVGSGGKILTYNGAAWTEEPSSTTAALLGVTAVAADNAFAVGEAGEALHLDHTDGWGTIPVPSTVTGSINAVWANSPTRAWAVGDQGVLELGMP